MDPSPLDSKGISKMEPVPYTVGIIKPDTTAKAEEVEKIIQKIEEAGFQIYDQEKRTLKKEDIINLFAKYEHQDFFDEIKDYMLSGPCIILLLVHDDDPIKQWKEMIGPSDPEEARKSAPESFRAVYGGSNRITNEFHGSDNPQSANRDRNIFDLPIPEKEPDFQFEKNKITMEMLFKFLFPPNLEHPHVTGRLDVFALYGPIVRYQSVDTSFCRACIKIAKEELQNSIQRQIAEEKAKMGITNVSGINTSSVNASATGGTGTKRAKSKFEPAPVRLLKEEEIINIYHELCEECQFRCDNFTHLTCGRGGQHIMTDLEIANLVDEMNYQDILRLLTIEKGSSAKTMMDKIKLTEPKEMAYDQEHILALFAQLETDYYNRYNFDEMQKVAMEDRRIRMNYWLSKITGKPIEKFKNPNMLNSCDPEERNDPKSVHFTLSRILPLSVLVKKEDITYRSIDRPKSIVDKKKLTENEEKIVLHKLLSRETHQLVPLDDVNNPNLIQSVRLLRNYHPGRHGSW
eukprot:CAMPEP_0115000986 /NCGR_PEP_ID=MMETSP0216-20121206/17096_1 /TAXON_ID=223996 /ORGANISM="Protocruzia adherens, Strain Boccale" /LENGTH=516 /DNA_ID=CAMNT_0002366213 /DNA_START=5 /DNA_END=1552 /DNA_ORIENTATION=+